MYTLGALSEDYTEGRIYAWEILDPEGVCICHVIQVNGDDSPALALLSHLNRD